MRSLVILSIASLAVSSPRLLAQDECATATAVALGANGPFNSTGSTVSAPTWPCASVTGGDVWYTFTTGTLGGVLTVDTEGSTGLTDTVLQAFDGAGGCGSLVSLGCDDDSGTGTLSRLTLLVSGNTTYLFRVGGFGSSVGVHNLNLALVTPDECAGAIPIVDGVNGPFNNTGSTGSVPAVTCATVNRDIWFKHTASCNGTLTINTEGPGTLTDTVMDAWDACGGTSLGCDDDGGPSLYSQLSFPVVAGTTYWFRVGGFLSGQGTFNIRIVNVPTTGGFPDNCACAAALTLGANAVTTVGSTVSSPAWSCSSVSGGDTWYSYTVAGPGCVDLTIDTEGSTGLTDTVLELWDDCGGNVLACDDDSGTGFLSSITLPTVNPGFTVRVRLGAFGSATGTANINVTETSAAPADDECAGATPLSYGLNAGLDNFCCTPSTPAIGCSTSLAPVKDKWFTFQATCTAPHTFSMCSSLLGDTVLEVLDDCTNLTSLGCNDDSCGLRSVVTVSLTNGVTYLVRAGGWNNAEGVFDIDIQPGTGPGSQSLFQASACANGIGLSITGDLHIGGTVTLDVTGVTTGFPLVAYDFAPPITVVSCGCSILDPQTATTYFFPPISLPIPCSTSYINLTALVQGFELFFTPTTACEIVPSTIWLKASDIMSVTLQ